MMRLEFFEDAGVSTEGGARSVDPVFRPGTTNRPKPVRKRAAEQVKHVVVASREIFSVARFRGLDRGHG